MPKRKRKKAPEFRRTDRQRIDPPQKFDDAPNIQNNPHIRLTKLTLEGIKRAGFESRSSSRPVANISFALNYYFHQYNVAGYHLVNILIHITTGILLYLFVKTTLNIPSVHSRYGTYLWLPFLTALLWAVHPINTQSVTYIVQRMNSMAAMFYVLSLFLYARARLAEKRKRKVVLFTGCIFAGVLALGSKQIAGTLPLFIVLYEWYFIQEMSRTWLRRHLFHLAIVLVVFGLMAIMYLGVDPLEWVLSRYEVKDFTLSQRLLTEFRVVVHYLSLLIFPHPSRLNLDYDFPLSNSLIDPITTLFSIIGIAGLLGFAIYLAKRERLLSFCILWFLGNLVIESSFIPLAVIFEHRTYLPSVLLIFVFVVIGYRYMKPMWLRLGVACVVILVFSLWTYERNSVWSDDVGFFKDCVAKSPKKARPHLSLGFALEQRGKLKEAMTHYSEALRLKPDYAEAHYNQAGVLMEQEKFKEAMSHYSEALRIKPDYAKAHYNLGVALSRLERFEEAARHFSEALRLNPDYFEAHYNLGVALVLQGDRKGAAYHFSQALRIDPGSSRARLALEKLSQ
jgi:tetratricopeptide (TPR) repeat protein